MSSPMSTLPSETDLVFIRRSCVHVKFSFVRMLKRREKMEATKSEQNLSRHGTAEKLPDEEEF